MNLHEAKTDYESAESEKALEIFSPIAGRGDAEAQGYLGEMYRFGMGVEEDAGEAFKWFSKAAEQGHNMAQFSLGEMYLDGEGVQQDCIEAAKWLQKAAEGKYTDSHYQLGRLYLEGLGVRQDATEAAKWFCKGAELGDSRCMAAFADLYEQGVYLREDECELVKMFLKAIEEGDSGLQRYLGLREYGYRTYFNKLTIFTTGGLLSMALLAWYDWIMIAEHVMAPVQKVGWFYLIFAALDGLYLGGWLSDVPYRVGTNARVTGMPFPVVLWEPSTYNGDDWLDFQGLYTIVSPLLNACFLSLILLAILLTVPAGYTKPFFYLLLVIASFKGFNNELNR